MVYRLFLSHSSPEEPAKERLRNLAQAIQDAAKPGEQIRVLYDAEQISTADDWHKRIAFMLHVCHGAAVLIDEAAIRSKWVLAEATFASLRHAYNPDFACVPISFIDADDLERAKDAQQRQRDALRESDWSVAALDQIQYAKGNDVAQIADDVVEALRKKGLLQPNNPIDLLADGLATLLEAAPAGRVDELAAELEQSSPYLSADRRRLAGLALVQKMLRSLSLKSVRDVLNDFGIAFKATTVKDILKTLAPLVLSAEASEMLHRCREDGGYAHASLCCGNPEFFVPLYLQRAHLSRRPPTHFAIENDYAGFEQLRARLRDGWRGEQPRTVGDLSDEDVDYDLGNTRVYVWVAGEIDEAVIHQFNENYPTVSFILLREDAADTPLPPTVFPITPALTIDEQRKIRADYRIAMASLNGGF